MDSKQINQAIKKHIITLLKENGLEIFTNRTAWRYIDKKIAWGFGAKSSPSRSYKTGYIALALGDYKLASEELKKAINSGCYNSEQLKKDYQLVCIKAGN